jgi:cell division protein ZapA (FtsZ GTPase activity inhibitor)
MTKENESTRQVVPVQIAGRNYKIRSDGNLEELQRIAGYVDRAMDRVKRGTGTVDSLDVAMLTCLNLAREILSLRETRVPRGSTVVEEAHLRGLIDRVEALLPLAFESDSADESETDVAEEEASHPSAENEPKRRCSAWPHRVETGRPDVRSHAHVLSGPRPIRRK